MNKLPWFSFYPADWIKGTAKLSNRHRGIWINLLAHMWEHEPQGQVSGDWAMIARLIGEDRSDALIEVMEMCRIGVFDLHCSEGICTPLSRSCSHHVTLMSRRMSRECHARKLKNKNQQKRRESAKLRQRRKRDDRRSQNEAGYMSYISKEERHEAVTHPEAIPTKIFKKPTIPEIQAYCLERGNRIDAGRFFDYYEANGWRAGRVSMKDWRAAVRNWERSATAPQTKGSEPWLQTQI